MQTNLCCTEASIVASLQSEASRLRRVMDAGRASESYSQPRASRTTLPQLPTQRLLGRFTQHEGQR